MASAGRILIMPKGVYDPSATYKNLDLVSHNGKSWLAKKTVIGIEPSAANSEHWHDLINITAENVGAVQRKIWKWVNNKGDSLFAYIKSKLDEGYTSGNIQVEATNGIPVDVPNYVIDKTTIYFMCSFQRQHYDYVRVTIWGASIYEFCNWGRLDEGEWKTEWRESVGGTLIDEAGGTRTKLTVKNGKLILSKEVDGVEVGSTTVAEIT